MLFLRRSHLALAMTLSGAFALGVWMFRKADDRGNTLPSRPVETAASPRQTTPLSLEKLAPPPPLPVPQVNPMRVVTADEAEPADVPATPAGAVGQTPVVPALTDEEVWAHYEPSREELEYRAFHVEQQANRELKNLLQVLDLDEAQQDRVFAALVQNSALYHPALRAEGGSGAPAAGDPSGRPAVGDLGAVDAPGAAPGAIETPDAVTPTDPVLAELTPEQTDVYERYASEREAFWVGVVEDVEQELQSTP
jgi:hypothetical protein